MSQFERNMDVLNRHRLIYIRQPIDDIPTEVYDWGEYYADGTYECYELFKSKAKITSYKSLKWHVLVLRYLNPNIKDVELKNISRHITNIKNNFITFKPSDRSLDSIIQDVLSQSIEDPPRNKRRKIIFKEFSQLTLDEKLKIVGQMVGRSKRITEEDIYEMMIEINDNGKKITINEIADKLSCSARTIHRTMSDDLKKEKDVLNLTL